MALKQEGMAGIMSDLITASQLGKRGRWGNQVFQYAFLRAYAKRHNLDYQANQWIGQTLMGHDDPPVIQQLPQYKEKRDSHCVYNEEGEIIAEYPELGLTYPPLNKEGHNHDVNGYCQFHTSYYAINKDFVQGLFVPLPGIQERMAPAVTKLREQGKTVIAFHLRRGDTGRFIFYLTPNQWYLKWLEEHWGQYDNPVLFIASEEPSDRDAFAKYNPVMSSDLLQLENTPYAVYNYLQCNLRNPTPVSMDWFPDWYLLNQSDVLIFGNSTFSYSAGMMNPNLQSAWRSRLSTQEFEQTDLWNDWPLIREDLRNYPGIADTWYDRTRLGWTAHSR